MLTGPRPARYRNGGTYLLFSTLRRGSGIGMEIRWLSGRAGQGSSRPHLARSGARPGRLPHVTAADRGSASSPQGVAAILNIAAGGS